MTHYTHRCKHCGTKYTFQGSGEGCHEPTNNRKYCPVCITAINDALAKLPKLSVQKWVPSPDISKKMAETILRVDHWRRKYISNNPDKFHESVQWNAMFVRVAMGGDCFEYNGREYFLSCDGKVSQKIWWNVKKDEAAWTFHCTPSGVLMEILYYGGYRGALSANVLDRSTGKPVFCDPATGKVFESK